LPGIGQQTPITRPDDVATALSQPGVSPKATNSYDPNNPGTPEEQLRRAAYRQTAGLPPDPAPQAGAGDKFQIDIAEFPGLINHFQRVADRAHALGRKLNDASAQCTPPALDPKSVDHSRSAVNSLNLAAKRAGEAAKYADDLVAKLTATQSNYHRTDSHNSTTIKGNRA
jgi:hypothetical protein